MKTLPKLLEATGDSDTVAIGVPAAGEQVYTYDRLRSTVYSTANLLSDAGISEGSRVAIAPKKASETVVAFLGAASLGATVWFGGPARANVDALLAPTEYVDKYQIPSDSLRVGYGSAPDDDSVVHFGKAVWKADETPPQAGVLPGTKLLTDGENTYSHRELLDAAAEVVDARDIEEGTVVSVRAPLRDPRTIAAGIVAPLSATGTIRFPSGPRDIGDLGIADDDAPEPRLMLLLDVPLE